jgi:hypothetical protein
VLLPRIAHSNQHRPYPGIGPEPPPEDAVHARTMHHLPAGSSTSFSKYGSIVPSPSSARWMATAKFTLRVEGEAAGDLLRLAALERQGVEIA